MNQMLKNSARGLTYALAALMAFGCASKPTNPGGPGAAIEDHSTGVNRSAETSGVNPNQVTTVNVGGPQESNLSAAEQRDLPREMRVHFAFDSDSLDIPNQAIAREHAQYMLKYPNVRLRIEGNTDERGTREYNLALGERRAQAVKDFLVANGVSPDRIEIISFGAEKPLNPGHDESAWAENRRADFVYLR